jgi:hypothetical protein
VTQPILDASRVVAGIGQRVAARVAQHVGVNRKGEACPHADALDEPVDGVGCGTGRRARWRRRRPSPAIAFAARAAQRA